MNVKLPSQRMPEAIEEASEIWLEVASDIDAAGNPATPTLYADQKELRVDAAPGQAGSTIRLPWTQIEKVRTWAGTGSGWLQAQVDGAWIDLLRYSNAQASKFSKVSLRLTRHLDLMKSPADSTGEPLTADPAVRSDADQELEPKRCPECSLRLEPSQDQCPRCLQKGRILKRLFDLLAPYRRGALLLTGLTIAGVIAELIPPKLQQHLVDNILGGGAQSTPDPSFAQALLLVVLALAGSRILLSAVGVFKGRLATQIGTGITASLRAEMVHKLQRLAVVYYDRHQVGSILSRVAHDSEVLHGVLHQITGGFLLQTAQLIGVGAMLLWINPKLAMYTLIPVPLVFLGSWIFWQKVYPRYYRLWDASSKQMSVLNGMLSGIRVVKAFAQEDKEYQRFQKASDQLRQWRLWVDDTNSYYSAAMQLVFSLGGLIVWYVGGRDVIGRDMTLGQLIAFLAYLAMFYAPLSALSNFTTWLTSFLSGSKRVLELLDAPLTIPESSSPKAWNDPRGEVVFDRVTFGYDRSQPVLQGVSFRVAPGEMVGIVGRSGSGKTTMVNLLARFYDVQEGSIRIDGIDLRDLSTQLLRQRVGIVFQDSLLFRGTVWKNLSYGHPTATIEEGLEAAAAAGAHDFLCRSPLGYETLLGEHGAGLSGGEKQRLSIARTLLYDPRILILDEATSNIDAESERSIQEALEVLVRGRTTIAIAHRLSTLRNADRILVFERGLLKEEGSHAQLLAKDGIYARLVRIQTQVSKHPTVDRLIGQLQESHDPESNDSPEPAGQVAPQVAEQKKPEPPQQVQPTQEASPPTADDKDAATDKKPRLHWLNPSQHHFCLDSKGRLAMQSEQQQVGDLFVVRTFPASHPDQYLSIRQWKTDGEEPEIGMIADLQQWPADVQALIRQTADRRYLLRVIQRVYRSKLDHGFLELDVETDIGRQSILMRWTQSQAVDYGDHGKLITDTEENRWVVPSVDQLPSADRERFLQFIYW